MTQKASHSAGFGGALVIATLALAGCATEQYVQDELGPVRAQAEQAQGTANEALQRANAAHKLAEGKFLYEVVLSDDSVKFSVNSHQLSPEAVARLDELAQRLKGENRNVYLEIQGFTDAQGAPAFNERLGEARAEAVRRYLHEQGVALSRMATISYGEAQPVAPNDTAAGRAQNRRVAIVVLS